MIGKILFSIFFCLGEALLSSILILQQQYILDYLGGDRGSIFPADFGNYLTPFAFRALSFQLLLQISAIFLVCRYTNVSYFKLLGGIALSLVIWSLLLFLYFGDFSFQIAAITNLHWVAFSAFLSWLVFKKLLVFR